MAYRKYCFGYYCRSHCPCINLGQLSGRSFLSFNKIKYNPNINESIYKFANSTASWLTQPLDWHLFQLRAKSILGALTAADINNLDNYSLKLVSSSLLLGLRTEEVRKLDDRVWQLLPVDTKEKFISLHSSTPRVELLNERAEKNEPLSADEINELEYIETYSLLPEVFNNLTNEQLGLLFPRVLNYISDLTLVQLEARVPLHLSTDALAGLSTYFLNNFSIDLAEVFQSEELKHLSAQPVRWQSWHMTEPNIKTPAFVNKVKDGSRMYWVEKNSYTH